METYAELKEMVENPRFQEQKEKCLAGLRDDMIDSPILNLVNDLNRLPFCFTQQCCYGHFLFKGREDAHCVDPLLETDSIMTVEYRIAYIALCIENSGPGKKLYDWLKLIPQIDPQNVQFFCAEWFWKKQVNSFALQVEPDRFKDSDQAIIDYQEALKIERIRNEFFTRLRKFTKSFWDQ